MIHEVGRYTEGPNNVQNSQLNVKTDSIFKTL